MQYDALGEKRELPPEWKLNCVHYFIRIGCDIKSTRTTPLTKLMYYRLLMLLRAIAIYYTRSEALGEIGKYVREHEAQEVKDKEEWER